MGAQWQQDVKRVHDSSDRLRPIEEAISTVGGIALDQVSPTFH
jgi:predicted flavoprotein YhiN